MSKESGRKRPHAGRFLAKRIMGPFCATSVAAIVLILVLARDVTNWHPDFAKAMITGEVVVMMGGFFFLIRDIVTAAIEYWIGDDD